MSEIFVEEENTVYELDAECLKRKEEIKRKEEQKRKEQEKRQKGQEKIRNKNSYQAQKTTCRKQNQTNLWLLCLLFLIMH